MLTTLPFGRTGHDSSRVIFGAAALAAMSPARADATLQLLGRYGVNHIDTAARYGDSELRLAPFLREHRARFFLATKTGERGYDGARDEIRRSIERLGIEQLDLIQLHNLVRADEQDEAFSVNGALRAAREAQDAGLVRFIGVTGHGTIAPAAHLRSLDHFGFDSVLVPYNYSMMQDAAYAADLRSLLTTCAERGVAVQTIKSIARRRWRPDATRRFSWYEPVRSEPALARLVQWALAEPGVFLNTSSDATLLDATLRAAANAAGRPDEATMARDQLTEAVERLFVRGVAEDVG